MKLLAASYVLALIGALATAPIVAAVQGPLLRRAAWLEPTTRARWVLAMLALPWAVGVGLVLVTLGHCVVPGWFGAVDDCVPGVGVCMHDGAPVGRATLVLAALLSLRPLHAVWRAVLGVLASRRAAAQLRTIAARSTEQDPWTVPGSVAAVVGFPREEIFVGEGLRGALDQSELEALLAHERAHRSRRDLWRKLAARVMAAAHFDASGRELLAVLDLAIEQRCDEHASDHVRDPLVVASALVRAAKVNAHEPHAPATLSARIHALCAPAWVTQPALALAAMLTVTVTAAVSIAFAHYVHNAAESMLAVLARA